jgi:hypothetical protein
MAQADNVDEAAAYENRIEYRNRLQELEDERKIIQVLEDLLLEVFQLNVLAGC